MSTGGPRMTVQLTVRQAAEAANLRSPEPAHASSPMALPAVATFIYPLLADGIWPHCVNMWILEFTEQQQQQLIPPPHRYTCAPVRLPAPTAASGRWGNFTAVDCWLQLLRGSAGSPLMSYLGQVNRASSAQYEGALDPRPCGQIVDRFH